MDSGWTEVLCHHSINASELDPIAGLAPPRCEHTGRKSRKRTGVYQPSGCQLDHGLANGKRHGTGGPINGPERGTQQLIGAALSPAKGSHVCPLPSCGRLKHRVFGKQPAQCRTLGLCPNAVPAVGMRSQSFGTCRCFLFQVLSDSRIFSRRKQWTKKPAKTANNFIFSGLYTLQTLEIVDLEMLCYLY